MATREEGGREARGWLVAVSIRGWCLGGETAEMLVGGLEFEVVRLDGSK